jgi:hypothetical protein
MRRSNDRERVPGVPQVPEFPGSCSQVLAFSFPVQIRDEIDKARAHYAALE